MCNKAVYRYSSVYYSIPDQYKLQEMCDRVASEGPFLVVNCPDEYITQRRCDEAVDDSLADKFFPIGLLQVKLYTALYADVNILYFNEDSLNIVFSCKEMGILNIDLNNINLDNNFDEDDPHTIIFVSLLAWHIKFEKRKAPEKDK